MKPDHPSDSSRRQSWLRALAHAPEPLLADAARRATESLQVRWLREPETGLVMLRGRIGNQGDRYNVGEATVCRAVARVEGPDGTVTLGVGYVLGRSADRARRVALIDAALQQPTLHVHLVEHVLAPLQGAVESAWANQASEAETSRVRFYTLQPESA